MAGDRTAALQVKILNRRTVSNHANCNNKADVWRKMTCRSTRMNRCQKISQPPFQTQAGHDYSVKSIRSMTAESGVSRSHRMQSEWSIGRMAAFSDASTEQAFRQYSLIHDRRQSTILIICGALLCALFILADQRVTDSAAILLGLFAVRLTILAVSTWALLSIRHGDVNQYDRAVHFWQLLVAASLLFIYSTWPPRYLGQIGFDLILLVGMYVGFMTRFKAQILIAAIYALALASMLLLVKQIDVATLQSIIAALLSICLLGPALSWRLHWLGRHHFALLMREQDLREELESLAFTDSLTQIANRREFMNRVEEEFERHRRHGRDFSILMMDLDFFKQINDQYGHEVGDQVLKEVAQLLQSQRRTPDVVARIGGEEFAVLLPETKFEGAMQVASRIQQAARSIHFGPDQQGHCTISIGVAEVRPDDGTVNEIMSRTDAAMYTAKARGRNQIAC